MTWTVGMKENVMKKVFWIVVGVICAILVIIAATAGIMQLSVVNQPLGTEITQAEDLPTSNPWVTVRLDKRIFTLFAALNAAGYDQENFDQPYHPVRQQVRDALAGKNFSGQARLRTELSFLHPYNFIVWALYFDQPPRFDRVVTGWNEKDVPAFFFFGLDSELSRFYEEADIEALWEQVRPQYEEEAARYQAAAGQAVQEALDYTRMRDVTLKQVVIIPNLLSAHWSGFGPSVGETAYVIIGPTADEPDVSLVQHEVIHSIVGPLVEANLQVIDPRKADELYAALKKTVPSSYGSWESVVEEQMVRAVDCRLNASMCDGFILENDEAEGFLLERYFVNGLKEFEHDNRTLAEFMPELLRVLNEVTLP